MWPPWVPVAKKEACGLTAMQETETCKGISGHSKQESHTCGSRADAAAAAAAGNAASPRLLLLLHTPPLPLLPLSLCIAATLLHQNSSSSSSGDACRCGRSLLQQQEESLGYRNRWTRRSVMPATKSSPSQRVWVPRHATANSSPLSPLPTHRRCRVSNSSHMIPRRCLSTQ